MESGRIVLEIYQAESNEDIESVRGIQMEYVDWLKEMFAEYSNEPWFSLGIAELEQEVFDLPRAYCGAERSLLVAKTRDKIVGSVALKRLGNGTSEMKRLFVKSEYRGTGIGRELTEAMVKQAREIGYCYIRLLTYERMQKAVSLYWSMGFNKISPFKDESIADVIFMELKLE